MTTQDFRPSEIQLSYLNIDMQEYLAELGLDIKNNEYSIQSISWYNWNNNPRWFVFLDIYDFAINKSRGYIEVDMYVEAWNGSENPIHIDRIEIPGHGYPCNCTSVVSFEDGDYVIEGIE